MNMMNRNNMNNINMNMMNNMNMINQNNMNMMNGNNMNQMNQTMMTLNNMNMINQNNMNMMNGNNMNMMNQNNMNMMNQNNNFNMNNNNLSYSDPKILLMERLFEKLKAYEDGFQIQKGIALGLNNNQQYNNYVSGGEPGFSFLTTSSVESQSKSENPEVINIIFITLKGNKHIKRYNKKDKIKNVLKSFVQSFGLTENALTKINFLYNATNLNNLRDDMTLEEFNVVNNSRINVIDINDIIGA